MNDIEQFKVQGRLGGLSNGARQMAKTHCPKGHPYDEENTYHNPRGFRSCRLCKKASDDARRARKKRRA